MSDFSNPVVKANKCAQYVVDIRVGATNASNHTLNIRGVFECIREAGLKIEDDIKKVSWWSPTS